MICGPDDLNVSINNGCRQASKSAIIYSNNINDITIDLGSGAENDIGQEMIIYAQYYHGTVIANAQGDRKELGLYCPINDGTSCVFNNSNNVGNDQCKASRVYTNDSIDTDLQFRVSLLFLCLSF